MSGTGTGQSAGKDADALRASLRDYFLSSSYENRYTLHPRILGELARQECETFLGFLKAREDGAVLEHGRTLAREGFGLGPVARLAGALRGACSPDSTEGEPPSVAGTAAPRAVGSAQRIETPLPRDPVDRYAALVLEGYLHAREEQILSDQEQLRRALSSALEEQTRELAKKNHAIDTSINGIMLADLGGTVTYVNAAFLELWGFKSFEELGRARMADFWATEETRQLIADLPRSGRWHGELTARRGDGSTFEVEMSASLIRDGEGRPLGIMSSFVDVTEAKRLRSQVQQVQKMDALGQLAGGIAHDFNNLLTAISGYLQLLLLKASEDKEMSQDLQQIRAAVERGVGLTRQLRYFTRQATGTRQIMVLNDAIKETAELLRRTFPPDIHIQLFLQQEPWPLMADPNQMSQVLMNLGVNGRDAMQERTRRERTQGAAPPPRTLTFETRNIRLDRVAASRFVHGEPGRYVLLRVADEGTGIPPDLLDRLFIPFFTTKSSRSGTGLGLAVVYGIVRNHQGFIEVHSEVGRGTSFEVYLPAARQRRYRPPREGRSGTLAPGAGTVLVVDDEPGVRSLLERALGDCGYTVLAAEHGEAALAIYREHCDEVDLVILDMIMPVMGGRECLKGLREIDSTVKVLLITGYTTDGSAEELLKLGAVDLVEKPLDLRAFTEKVRRTLSAPSTPRGRADEAR